MSNAKLLFCSILWAGWLVLTIMFVAGIIPPDLPNLIVWAVALVFVLGTTLLSVSKEAK